LVLLLGVVAWRLLASSSTTPNAEQPRAVAATAIGPATVVTPPAALNPPPAPVVAPSAIAVEPTAAAPSGAESAGTPKPAAAKPTSTAKKPAAKAKGGVDCSRPFVLDAQGHKRFKPECF
jgi:hypothetical protein